MNQQKHNIQQFLELDRSGQAKYLVVDVQPGSQNRVLFNKSTKVFARFDAATITLSNGELRTLTQFLLNSLKQFITIFPVYKNQVTKLNLLVPNEVVKYESVSATFDLAADSTSILKLTPAIIQAKWSAFVAEHQQVVQTSGEAIAIDCSCLAMKINGHWMKTPVIEQTLVNPEIEFASEWQQVQTAQFAPLLGAISKAGLGIGKVNALSKISCNPQLNNWLYAHASLVVEWGEESTWVKYYDGQGNLFHEQLPLGIKDLYERTLFALDLDVQQDYHHLVNIVENYFDFQTVKNGFKNFSVLRGKNDQAIITTYTMSQVVKTLINKLDELLVTIKETIAFKLGINPQSMDYQIHCGLVGQLTGIEEYFADKHIKLLPLEVDRLVVGNINGRFDHLLAWARINQLQAMAKVQTTSIAPSTLDEPNNVLLPTAGVTSKPLVYYPTIEPVIGKELEK